MARDYKNRSSRKNAAAGRLAGLVTFVAGLVTGLCVAVGFYLVEGLPALMQSGQESPVVATSPPEKAPGTTENDGDANRPADSKPTPRFDFYTILPEMEVSVPEWETRESAGEPVDTPTSAAAGDAVATPATDAERYILQIGSFRQPDEAERVKANLALLGISTEIQRVVIDDGDVWHRVRAGPYQGDASLNQTRQRLIENDIDFMLLRLKPDSA